MHKEVTSEKAGVCPKCGMALVMKEMDHSMHNMDHTKKSSWWERFKMSMTMSMGMDHTGLAGREMAKMMEIDIRNKFFISLVLTIPIVTFTYISLPFKREWLLFALTTPVYFYCGWIFLYSSYLAIKQKTLNMAVLIAVGITAAYIFSIIFTLMGSTETFYEASAMLTAFVLFGHWMEMKSRRGTTDALQALFNLVPPQARVIRNGKEEIISTSEVKVGDIILIKPGDKIPVDGKITEGESAIDESLVTGESIPVSKTVGDLVIGGSINTSGSIKFMATKIGEDTALAQIVKMVETAQNSKAPGQKIADRFAKYLVIVAVGGGLITFVVWFFVLGQPLMLALTFAISTVVIACPDALGLATPTAVAVGTGLGAKHNILIKDAPTLEQVSKIQAIVLDKTGTLTEGKPKITDIIVINNFKEDEILELAGSVEAKSGHPLSKAILEKIEENKLKLQEVSKFNSISGHGVEAIVNNQNVLIGTIKLMNDRKIDIKPIQKETEKLLSEGKTIMLIAVDNKIAGVIAVQDLVKQTSKMAVEKMQELGLEVAMITGDNKKTAEIIGKNLGIERVFSEVLPVEKEQYVKKMQDEGKFTAMVGDGVNDAPALARANIGIAIGAGTDVAIETANVVLMKSDPMDILRAIILSKATVRKMKENLVWASIYNLLAIPIAAGVLYPSYGITLKPEFAALLMSISSIIVAVNAVSLKRIGVKLN
jgi:Cu2+-exporting ATPase